MQSEFIKKEIMPERVVDVISVLPGTLKPQYESYLSENIPKFEKAENIREFLHMLYIRLHFLDYGLIEHLIKRLGSKDLKFKISGYKKDLVAFLRLAKVKHIIESEQFYGRRKSDLPEEFVELKAVINQNSSSYSLEQLDCLRRKLCSQLRLLEVIVYLKGAKDVKSFLVSWLFPAVLCEKVVEAINHMDACFILREQIIMITVGEKTFCLQDDDVDLMVSCKIDKII